MFEKMNNVNNELFAFNNGVWDLKERKFRLLLSEELIICTCSYDYEEFNEEIENVKNKINRILNSFLQMMKINSIYYLLLLNVYLKFL
jgi:hypothetical protein